MVQRILMLALVLLAFTMPTEAITLQELQTSPQFKLVHTRSMNGPMASGGLYIYLNTYSIEATHYAPPQYSLRGTYYVVIDTDYQSTIEEKQLTVDYDTNYSLATLIHSSHMMNPSPSTLALIEASESKSGLSLVDVAVAKYSFDGAAQQMQYRNDTRKFPLKRNNTIMYYIAEAMFMAAYQQHFDDIVVQ